MKPSVRVQGSCHDKRDDKVLSFQDLGRELTREENEVEEELQLAEKYLEGVEQKYKLPPFIEAPFQFFRSIKIPFLKLGQ